MARKWQLDMWETIGRIVGGRPRGRGNAARADRPLTGVSGTTTASEAPQKRAPGRSNEA